MHLVLIPPSRNIVMARALCTAFQESPGKPEVAKSVRARMAQYSPGPAKSHPGDQLEPSTGDLQEPSAGDLQGPSVGNMLEPSTGDLLARVPVCRSVSLNFYYVQAHRILCSVLGAHKKMCSGFRSCYWKFQSYYKFVMNLNTLN